VLLLRQAIFGLRLRGDSVALLAPGASILAEEVEAWDYSEAASLFSEPSSAWRARLSTCQSARLYSRSPDLLRSLRASIPDVKVIDPQPGSGHAAAWYAQGLPEGPVPALVPTPDEREAGAVLLSSLPRGFLALHPGSGSPRKNWPFFREFAELWNEPFLVVEGPADAAAVGPLKDLPGARLARFLPPRVLGFLLSEAGLLLGNDSGISHLGAAFGGRVLALFGPTEAKTWAPLGERVDSLSATNGDLGTLSPATVLARVRAG
jgi:ADP-heptose:LPS heptosyltransferase